MVRSKLRHPEGPEHPSSEMGRLFLHKNRLETRPNEEATDLLGIRDDRREEDLLILQPNQPPTTPIIQITTFS